MFAIIFTTLRPASITFWPSLQRHNSPADWAREVFKLSTNSASLLDQTGQIFFVSDLGFSVGDVTIGACFRLFGQVYIALVAKPTGYFLAQAFLETRL